MKYKIGFSIGSILSIKDSINFASNVDKKDNVDSIWVPESWGKEAFSTLGAISQVTKKTKLGTSIINIYSRTPATIAMGAISIDKLSNHRMIIGLGTSTLPIVENLHGMKYEKPLTRMKEYIESIKHLVKSQEKIHYNGDVVKINNFKISDNLTQDVPVYIAAVHEKMIQTGLKYADGLILYLRPINEIKETLNEIRKESKKKISMVLITSVSNNNPNMAKERAAKTLAFYIAVGKVYYNFLLKTEYKTDVQNIFKTYHNHGINKAIKYVSTKMLDDFVVYGSVNDCINQIKRFINAGIDSPILQINPVTNNNGEIETKDFLDL